PGDDGLLGVVEHHQNRLPRNESAVLERRQPVECSVVELGERQRRSLENEGRRVGPAHRSADESGTNGAFGRGCHDDQQVMTVRPPSPVPMAAKASFTSLIVPVWPTSRSRSSLPCMYRSTSRGKSSAGWLLP